MVANNYITIEQSEYEQLIEAQRFLECLRAVGVENSDLYDEAMYEFNQEVE